MVTSATSSEYLRQCVAKIERLEQDKSAVLEDLREVYAEAKSQGFDTKVVRQIIRLRKMDKNTVAEQEELLDLYKNALGML